MKKITPYILIFFIFVNLFAPLSLELRDNKIAINKNEVKAADNCSVVSVNLSPTGGSTKDTAIAKPSIITATIKTKDCVGGDLRFDLVETFDWKDANVFTHMYKVVSDELQLKLAPSEVDCGAGVCGLKYTVYAKNDAKVNYFKNTFETDNAQDYFFKCATSKCNTNTITPWSAQAPDGTELPLVKSDIDYVLKINGAVTTTDTEVKVKITINDLTSGSKVSQYFNHSFFLNVALKDEDGKLVEQSEDIPIVGAKFDGIEPVVFTVKPFTSYTVEGFVRLFLYSKRLNDPGLGDLISSGIIAKLSPISFTSNVEGDDQVTSVGSIGIDETNKDPSSMPACGIKTLLGCVAQGIYYVLFQPTSYLFALSGTLFDNAFAYSVDSASYRSPFVVEGWKIVRDFCNMFFIFILLYIAFGTILNLNGVKTKEMIINVVLIGIFINFSLFASQVIIDASNILARVFYNSNTITVKINDSSVGSKVIPLSAALVNKINPQEIILSASKINTVQDTRGKSGGATNTNDDATTSISTGTFILVTLLSTIVNVVGIFVFFSIAFIFIARVIGLWLAMILVPFAFLSYTVPAMQDFEMVGWKKWWPETIKLAFLAPVFIFFLYLILQFIEIGFMVVQNDAQPGGLNLMIGIILPFVFIMLLLLKAKSVATTMSGKIGEAFAKAGSAIGGMVVGGAGGLAMGALAGVGRRTIGALGEKMGNSETLKDSGMIGRGLANAGRWTAGKNFDVRSTKLGAAAGKGMGVDFGKAKEGGYTKYKEDKIKKKQQAAKNLEVGERSPLMHDLHEKEEAAQKLKNDNSLELTALDPKIEAGGKDATEKNNNAIGLEKIVEKAGIDGKGNSLATQEQQDAAEKARGIANEAARILQENKDKKIALRTGSFDEKNKKYRTSNGNITKEMANAVDDNVVDNAIAQASDDQKEATASGEAAANAIVAEKAAPAKAEADRKTAEAAADLAETDAKDNAAGDKKTAEDAADVTEKDAKDNAEANKTAAYTAAAEAATAATTKAATDKVAAIEAAQARVTAATAAAAAAETAQAMNPNSENKKARDAAVAVRNSANANLGTVTTDAENKEIVEKSKAATDKKTAEDAADVTEKDAKDNAKADKAAAYTAAAEVEKEVPTKAAADKLAAYAAAAKAEKAAIKAASDAVNTAIKNANDAQAKATASGTNAAEKMRDLAAKNAAGGNYGRSINNLEFVDIPEAKHAISTVNNARKTDLADEYSNRIFNTEINSLAAHDIRMNSEIKSEVKGH